MDRIGRDRRTAGLKLRVADGEAGLVCIVRLERSEDVTQCRHIGRDGVGGQKCQPGNFAADIRFGFGEKSIRECKGRCIVGKEGLFQRHKQDRRLIRRIGDESLSLRRRRGRRYGHEIGDFRLVEDSDWAVYSSALPVLSSGESPPFFSSVTVRVQIDPIDPPPGCSFGPDDERVGVRLLARLRHRGGGDYAAAREP